MSVNMLLKDNLKVVVTDVDATITDDHRRIDLESIGMIRALRDVGIPTILASGNAYPVILYLAKFIGTASPVVAENGGVVGWEERDIKKVLGSREKPLAFVEDLKKEYQITHLESDAWRESEVVITRDLHYENLSALAASSGLKVEDTKFAYHISQPEVRKAAGVLVALGLLGLEASDAFAIGDSQNDVEMCEMCGQGAAVANATDKMKSAADYVALGSHGAGFVEIIRRFFPVLTK